MRSRIDELSLSYTMVSRLAQGDLNELVGRLAPEGFEVADLRSREACLRNHGINIVEDTG